MALLAAVVGFALPQARTEPGRRRAALYRLLTLVAAGLVVGCVLAFGFTLRGLVESLFCLALVVVTATDLEYRLIPNRVVVPASAVALGGMTVADPSPEWAIAATSASLLLLLAALVYPAGMGTGDVKLAFLMGAALGRGVAVALVVAIFASLVPSIWLLVRHGKAARTMGFPFGPLLALGSVVALFLGA